MQYSYAKCAADNERPVNNGYTEEESGLNVFVRDFPGRRMYSMYGARGVCLYVHPNRDNNAKKDRSKCHTPKKDAASRGSNSGSHGPRFNKCGGRRLRTSIVVALFFSPTPLRFISDSMILRRCLRLTMLACSLCLVNSEEPKLRGAIVPERTLEEEELARHSVPPTKKKTTKTTTAKKRTSSGPEETLAKSETNSTERAKTTTPTAAKTKSTTTKEKTAAPTTLTELEKTMSPVNDEDKKSEEANGPEEEADDESQLHDESQADGEQPSESQGPDESQKDGQQPTESQRPDESPQGNTQHDVSQEDEKQSDESQHKSKEDESDGSGNPSDATTDPCANAKTCLECEKTAFNSTLDEQTCVWKDSLCKLISKGEAPSETKCDEHEISAHNTTATQDSVPEEEQEEGSAMPLLVTIMFVLGVLVALRTYLRNHDVILFSGGGIPGIYRRQGLSPRSSRHTETYVVISCDARVVKRFYLIDRLSYLLQCPTRWCR